jgi:hypothetical protein
LNAFAAFPEKPRRGNSPFDCRVTKATQSPHPLLGERAGVRASQTTNFQITIKNHPKIL